MAWMQLNSLKSRFLIAIVIIVTAISFLFALALLTIKNRLEEVTFGDLVSDQMQIIIANSDDNTIPSLMSGWQFVQGADAIERLPAPLASLSSGSHHSVRVNSRYYQVERILDAGEPKMLLYDITDWENQEHAVLGLLGWGLLVVLVLAIFLGIVSARPALRPVQDLTRCLATIRPDERHKRIGDKFADSEVGVIAEEFDHYLSRLDEFVERENFFTAAASHELRTPLSIIMGAVDIVEAQETDGTTRRAIARIRRACEDMLAFIETTLYLAREETRDQQIPGESHLETVVAQLLRESQPLAKARGLCINNRITSDPVLNATPSLVKIVVGNVLRNAIEHTRDGEIDISLDEGALVISDQGEGIAAKNLSRVYERNFTTKPGGTGLGLSLVKRICDRLGWQIQIDSEPGRGTVVRIIPLPPPDNDLK